MPARPRLLLGDESDPAEQQADQVADVLDRRLALAAGDGAALPPPGEGRGGAENGKPAPAAVARTLESEGEPLPRGTAADFSRLLGRDLSSVRVHADAEAAESARSVGAAAYSHGHDIAFGTGRYQPATRAGRRLLAHELTHVAQQLAAPTASHPVRRDGDASTGPVPLEDQAKIPASKQIIQALQKRDPDASGGVGDFAAAYKILDAQAMFAMLDILDELRRLGEFELLKGNVDAAVDVNKPRVQVAIDTVAAAGSKTADAFAADHQDVLGGLPQDQRDNIRDFLTRRAPPPAPAAPPPKVQQPPPPPAAKQAPQQEQKQPDQAAAAPEEPIMGGDYYDYKDNPQYLDNFTGALYDAFSKTVHVFFDDGGEAIIQLPLGAGSPSTPILYFQRKSLLLSPTPKDFKIYPSIMSRNTLPIVNQWLADHKAEMDQADLLLEAGIKTLSARSVPPNLWWLNLLAPAVGLARFGAFRMRPAMGEEPTATEKPVVVTGKTPMPKTGGAAATTQGEPPPAGQVHEDPTLPQTAPGQKSQAAQAVQTPGSGYATSVGELKEADVLRAVPGARSTPPKFKAYDGWTGGTTTETMQQGKSGSVVVQTVKDATWINIVSPETATPEAVTNAVNTKLRSSWQAEQNPSGRTPATDPEEVDPGVKFRVVKDGPAKAVMIVVNVPGPLTDAQLAPLQQAANDAVAKSPLAPDLPNLTVKVTSTR